MNNRYDFVLLFDVQDANPNGDPDAGNLPRLDAETSQGLVTDVCLKRKVRNFIQTTHPEERIYFTEGTILNNNHQEAYKNIGAEKSKATNSDARAWMCKNFFDVRTFGAVMSTGDYNCGQVRGPVQLSFARSIDPIVSSEHAITRSSVTNADDAKKERTIGRKFTIPYGLYRAHGFVNPFLAKQTGFSDTPDGGDLELFFTALENAFQFDQSAARPAGSMKVCSLLVFKHDSELGKMQSHALFDRLHIPSFRKQPAEDGAAPRDFAAYQPRITFDGTVLDGFIQSGESKDLGGGVTLIRRV